MPPRSFLVLCLLLASLAGCASSPPPTSQQPAYLVMVQPRQGMLWRLPDPPDVQLRPPQDDPPTRTANEQLNDAVNEFENFAADLNIRIERLLAQTPPRLPMPGCTSRCAPRSCTCN